MLPLLKRIQKFMQARSPAFIIAAGLLLTLLVMILDMATRDVFALYFFYILPIFLVTWYVDSRPGFVVAILAALADGTDVRSSGAGLLPLVVDPLRVISVLLVFLAIVALITVLKRDTRELDKSNSVLNSTLESTQDGILVVDHSGKFVSYNHTFAEMWKIPENILATHDDDKAINFVLGQLSSPEDFAKKVKELYSHPDKESFDVLDFKDGRTFERYSRPQRVNDAIVGRVWSFRDVTERRRLDQQTAQLAAIVNSSSDAIISKTLEGIITSWNRGAERIYGYTGSEIIGKSVYTLLPPEKEEEQLQILKKIQVGESIEHLTTIRRKKNGEDFYMELTISPIRGPDGTILAASTIGHDITARRQAERELSDSENKLRSLFAAMTDVVIVYDRHGRYMEIAPTDPSLLVAVPAELLGKTMHDTFPKEDADRLVQLIQSVLGSGQKEETEYSMEIGGHMTWFTCTVSPMRSDTVMWVAHDITKRKRAESLQEVVYSISQAAISTESIEDLYRSIHATLAKLLHVENFYIAIHDPSSDIISFPYYVDQYDKPPADTKPRRGLTEYVLRNGQPLLAPAKVCDQLVRNGDIEYIGQPPIEWLGTPLRVEGQVIGVMATQSYQEHIHFDQEDLRLFEFVSSQVAQMIDRKRIEEKIRYLGIHDALTGLYNRAYFDEELKRLSNGRFFPVSVVMADLDHLKETNDQEGHAKGDELLRLAARVLRAAFRAEDVVARIGGDEFAVLLPGMDANLVEKAKQRILDNIGNQNTAKAGKPLQISMGVSTVEKGGSLEEALKTAYERMYQEKLGRR
jgi:diguanylate cyclase (GGDEF)-like protein/PAS domain S-box-containing protein